MDFRYAIMSVSWFNLSNTKIISLSSWYYWSFRLILFWVCTWVSIIETLILFWRQSCLFLFWYFIFCFPPLSFTHTHVGASSWLFILVFCIHDFPKHILSGIQCVLVVLLFFFIKVLVISTGTCTGEPYVLPLSEPLPSLPVNFDPVLFLQHYEPK